jgi:hypothetical protein
VIEQIEPERETPPEEHDRELQHAHQRDEQPLRRQQSAHPEARREHAIERTGVHLVEERAARARDREQQEHHADAGSIERHEAFAIALSLAHHVDDVDADAERSRRRGRRSGCAGRALRLQAREPRVNRGALLGRERAGVLLELLHPALHHQIRRARHRHFLQQSADHLRRDLIRHVGQEFDVGPLPGPAEGRRRLAEPLRQHDGDRHLPAAHQFLGAGRVERRARALSVHRGPDAQRFLLLQTVDDASAQLAAVFVDDGDADPRGGAAALVAEDGCEDRKEHDRQQERQRLRDAIALQVRPAHAQ